MLIQELKEGIMKDSLKERFGNKLIFIGEENFLENLYLKQLAKKTKSKLIFADDFLDIKKRLTTNTVFDNSGIFIIRNSTQFLKNDELFSNLVVPKGKYLILIFDKVDKRKSFFKDNANVTCEFEKMTTAQLTSIIQKSFLLNQTNCEKLCYLVGNDYGRLLLEIDKLKIMDVIGQMQGNDLSADELFDIALNEGLIYQEVNDVSFQIVDSILEKDTEKTFYYLQELKRVDDDAFKLLGLIYSYYKNLLLIKCNPNININRFVKGKLSRFVNKYSANEIIDKMTVIQDIEQGIKSGKVESDMALDVMIINLIF